MIRLRVFQVQGNALGFSSARATNRFGPRGAITANKDRSLRGNYTTAKANS